MSKLITVPTFRFDQGNPHEGGELPLQVSFYRDGIIEIEQDGEEITLKKDFIFKLAHAINNHYAEAVSHLNEK